MTEIFALTAYDWEFTTHYLYDMKDIPNKEELDKIWKIAYTDAKSKVRSGIRTEPSSDEILREMVNLLKENGIYPLKIWNYDVDTKKIEEDDSYQNQSLTINLKLTLRLIEASVLEEVLEVLEKNNASPILIGKVKLALR